MKEQLAMVAAFHSHFQIPHRSTPTAEIPEAEMRHEIMREENDEYLQACQAQDLTAIADALGDQLYVLCGTIIAHGLQAQIEDVFAEIHRSNMSKLDADGLPIIRADGKILKGPGYFPPDITPLLAPKN